MQFPYADIRNKAFMDFLPFAGQLTAGKTPDFGFFIENLETEVAEIDWIKVPTRYCKSKRFIIQVVGDSMEPVIMKNDYIVCEYHRHFQDGRNVVIMADFSSIKEGECAIKRIKETEDSWLFKSDNSKYEDIPVEKVFETAEYPIYGTVIYNLSKQKEIR